MGKKEVRLLITSIDSFKSVSYNGSKEEKKKYKQGGKEKIRVNIFCLQKIDVLFVKSRLAIVTFGDGR